MSDLAQWIIVGCWTTFLIFILFAAFSKKRTVKTDQTWAWSWLGFVLLVPLAIVFFRNNVHLSISATDIALWRRTALVNVAADIIVFLGFAIAMWGRITLGRNWNMNPSLQAHHELVESGPYAYMRHPMYTGLIFMLLGTVVYYGTLFGCIVFFLSLIGAWFKLSREEKILTGHFGQAYLDYKVRVKALVPFIW